MQYRGYELRVESEDHVLIATLHGTVISDAASVAKAEQVVDEWHNAP